VPAFLPVPSVAAPPRGLSNPSELCDMGDIYALIKMDDLVQTWAWSSTQARQALLALSSELRKLKFTDDLDEDDENSMVLSEQIVNDKDHAASCAHMVSDVLMLYAHTETLFVPHRYGTPRKVRYHDVAVVDVPGTNRVNLKNVPIASAKEGCGHIRTTEQGVDATSSSASFNKILPSRGYAVHEEILNWNVQSKEDYLKTATDNKQNHHQNCATEETMGNFGVAYLPSVESCFQLKSSDYTLQSRRTMMEHLRETPLRGWKQNKELHKLFFPSSILNNSNEEEETIVYGSPMFDDLLATIDSPSRAPTDVGPSTQRVLKALKSTTTVTNQNDNAADKVMENLTIVKEQVPENWIQCEHDACMKWRKIPIQVDVSALPEPWYCSMNQWDSTKCSCDAVEDSYDNDQDYQYVKEEIQSVKVGEKIDLFCQLKGGWSEASVKETRTNEGTGIVEAFCHYMVRGTQNWQQWIFPWFFLDFTDPTISLFFVHSLFFFFFLTISGLAIKIR
jgi:hypothetical protein